MVPSLHTSANRSSPAVSADSQVLPAAAGALSASPPSSSPHAASPRVATAIRATAEKVRRYDTGASERNDRPQWLTGTLPVSGSGSRPTQPHVGYGLGTSRVILSGMPTYPS